MKIFVPAAILLCAATTQPLAAQKVTAVTGVAITVSNLERELEFFTKVLDFQKIKEETQEGEMVAEVFGLDQKTAKIRTATLKLGEEKISLLEFPQAAQPSNPQVSQTLFMQQTRSNDLWFQHLAIVVSDMDSAYHKLLKNKVLHVSSAPQTLPDYLPAAAGIRAFYFRDPEGHNLELIWFPPGKGNPKWQSQTHQNPNAQTTKSQNRPTFLGIDHTAVGVSDTEQSMDFYREKLGLAWAGHSENYGTEQEHLNQVFGARLDINGLQAPAGFGVEFLRYIAPPGGRPYPADSRPTDRWHYQTEMTVDDLDKMLQKLENQGFTKISKRKARLADTEVFLLRDPDGHAVLLKNEQEKY